MARALIALVLVAVALGDGDHRERHLRGEVVADKRESGRLPGSTNPLTLDNIVMRRGVTELSIATNANKQALVSAKDAKAARQDLLARQAVVIAEEHYLKVKPLPPQARAELLIVRKYEALASMYAKHAREVLFGSRYIPAAAAEKAVEATKGWIKSDATASAEASSKGDNRQDRLAGAVAAAVEPYHLALLRNQKFCEETYAKAKSAQSSAEKLLGDAKTIALKAQEMQSSGMDGRETWGMAAGMTDESEKLHQWGLKLYTQANTACGTAGGYEMLEQQAAANAAMTTIMNAPAKLPPKR